MDRNHFQHLTFVHNRSLICLFIVIFSSLNQVTKAQTTFESPIQKIKHHCPQGWMALPRSYRCVKIVNTFEASAGASSHGIIWPDAKSVCEHEGAELLHLNVYGEHGLTVGNTVIFPETDLLVIYTELKKMDIPCVWTGMYYGEDEILRWSNGQTASEYEAFWAWRMPSHGKTMSEKNKFKRAVAACKEPLWDRYYYKYGNIIKSWYKKLPIICQMRAPLEDYAPCINGERVPNSMLCNGVNDCGDDTDEQDCQDKDKILINLEASANIAETNYQANQQSQWLVRAPPGVGIKAEMTTFDTEELADFVDVYIGGRTLPQMDSPSLATLSGKPELETFYSHNNYMMVTFSSDSKIQNPGGFALSVTPVYSNDQWDVTVDKDGKWEGMGGMTECTDDSMLEPGLRYVWIFTAPENSVLTLQFAGMKLCEGAFLELRDGSESESPLLAQHMGGEDLHRLVVTSTKNQMYVYLHTGNSVCKGGCIHFSVADGCVADLSTTATIVTSPGYGAYTPARYPNYIVCRYYLSTPEPATAAIIFEDFEMKDMHDNVKIYPEHLPAENETTTMPMANLTMGDTPGEYDVGGGKMTVIFTSSVTQNVARGFSLIFAQNCEYPEFNNDTEIAGSSENLGSGATLTVKCKEDGYFFAQEEHYLMEPRTTGVVMTCNMSRWNVRATPNCERRWCGFIPEDIDEKAFVDIGESTALKFSIGVRAGDKLQFGCFDELGVTAGTNPLTCPLNGEWMNRPKCGVVTCSFPPNSPANGNFSILNQNDGSGYDGQRIGSILGFTCDMGYVITEGPNTFCSFSGTYHIDPIANIQCTPKHCPLLPIENGMWVGDEVAVDSSINFKCNAGFEYMAGAVTVKDNVEGSVMCYLNETLEYHPACKDIDECGANNGGCQATCTNDEGSFTCSCDGAGFKPSEGDGNTCEDIDECGEGTDNCNPTGIGGTNFESCKNIDGSYTCECPSGYEIFSRDGLHGFFIPISETGMRVNDTYHLNHTCVPISCPPLPNVDADTTVVLSRKVAFGEGDTVDIDCLIGNKLINQSKHLPESDITFRMKCINGLWDGTFGGCAPAACNIRPYDEFIFPPTINGFDGDRDADERQAELGGTWSYGKSFDVLSCKKGATNPTTNIQPTYSLTDEINDLFVFTVTCVYDPVKRQYRLDRENAMDCVTYVNQTNCGSPADSPGATILTNRNGAMFDPTDTNQVTFESRLFFDCGDLQTDGNIGGVESTGSSKPFFACQSTGIWAIGSLNCKAPLCPDPGRIAGAEQVVVSSAGQVLEDTSYQVTTQVKYNCSRPGYQPEPAEPLKCVLNATGFGVWEGQLPKCVDKEAPTILNCPNETVFHDPFMPTNMDKILVTDNSGADQDSMRVTIKPPGYSPATPLGLKDLSVTYTFTDLGGNSENCTFNVRSRDKVAPEITCPSFSIKIDQLEPKDVTPPVATATDDSLNITIVTEPAILIGLTPANISQFVLFTATATDEFGNAASCQYTVQIDSEPCAPWALPEISNGTKTSRVEGGGYIVEYECNAGYAFYDSPEVGAKKVYKCIGPDQAFTPTDLPFCQPSEQSVWTYRVDIKYCNWDGHPLTLTDPTCEAGYLEDLKKSALMDSAADGKLREACLTYDFEGPNLIVAVVSDMKSTIIDEPGCPGNKSMLVEYTFQQILDPNIPWTRTGEQQSASFFFDQECRAGAFDAFFGSRLESRTLNIRVVEAFGGNCSELRAKPLTGGNPLDTILHPDESGFQCDIYDKQYTTNLDNGERTSFSEVFCYGCPAGRYPQLVNTTWTCLPVPVGHYKSVAGSHDSCPGNKTCLNQPCTDTADDYVLYCECPAGSNTYIEGATDISYCRTQCIQEGLVSENLDGLSPCHMCPSGTYASNSTSCEPCPGQTNTGNTGGGSILDCRQECPVGTYSADGYEPKDGTPCTLCPKGFYQELTAQTGCMECANDFTTQIPGSDNRTLCVTGADVSCTGTSTCFAGSCYLDTHQILCTCNEGYTKSRCDHLFDYCQSTPCAYDSGCELHRFGEYRNTQPANGQYFKCKCEDSTIPGLSGDLCENEPDDRGDLDCLFSGGRGSPRDQISGADCNCKAEFSGDNCENAADACMPNPCDPTHSIECLDFTVRHQCRCNPGWGGLNCDQNINECFSNPCRNGECIDGDNGYTCNCGDAFTGASCETSVDPCDVGTSVCTNAQCIEDGVNFLCLCDSGFEPISPSDRPGGDVSKGACQQINNCANTTCLNGGTCMDKVGSYECVCLEGFEGRDCQHNKDNCIPNPCTNGTCVDGDNEYSCDCLEGFTGDNCDTALDMCMPDPCNANNTKPNGCSTDISTAPPQHHCDCLDGFVGKKCETNEDDCVLGKHQCYHNGVCIDEVASYQCQCQAGWTGQRCEDQIDNCVPDPCVNGGICYDLHDDYRCVCPPTFAGKDCNSTTDICRDVKPCFPGSICMPATPTTNLTCICQPDRTGPNCELLIDGCLNNPCLHDGTCSYDSNSTSGFSCECATGYDGPICNDTVDYCASIACSMDTPCINIPEEQRGTCLCRGLKAPTTCTKDQDLKKDVYFGSPDQKNFASASWYSLRLGVEGKHDFTLGFWFRYLHEGGTGNILTLYGQKDAVPLEDDFWIVRIDDSLLHINNYVSTVASSFPYRGINGEDYKINSGRWIYCVLLYNDATGKLTVYMSTVGVIIDQDVKFDMPTEDFNYANIVLGYSEDETTAMNSTFEGYVSHVCLWNRVLEEGAIQQLTADRENIHTTTGELSGCMDFTPKNGARTYRDSQGDSDAGEDVTLGSNVEPSLNGCPKMPKSVTGMERPVQVDISAVTAGHSDVTLQAELQGSMSLVNGTYTNVIVGTSPNGKVATCYYDIYVKAYECSNKERLVNAPADVAIMQDGADGNHYMNFACPDTKSPSQPVPDFYTCPGQGAFHVSNQYEKFFVPQCADMVEARVNLDLRYIMPNVLPCSDVKNIGGIREDVLEKAQNLNTKWIDPMTSTFAFCPTDCRTAPPVVIKLTLVCLKDARRRRKRNSDEEGLVATLSFTDLPLQLKNKDTSELVKTLDLLWEFWIGDNNIFTPNVIRAELDPEGTVFDEKYICKPGQALILLGEDDTGNPHYICVKCAPGEYWEAAEAPNEVEFGYCRKVPKGYYNPDQERVGLDGVKKCNDGFTTEEEGAISADQCKELTATSGTCSEGYFINEENKDCEPCGIGFFQPEKEKFFCWPCPASKSTADIGTINIEDCKDACDPGSELVKDSNGNSECKPCAKGFIRENVEIANCVPCSSAPMNTTRGEDDGLNLKEYHDSDSEDCIIRNCMPGNEIDSTVAGGCKKCAVGFYQDKHAQEDCIKCEGDLTTENEEANNPNLCQLFCEAGHETVNATDGSNNKTCGPCKLGTYKKDRGITPCTMCPPKTTTAGTGSVDAGQCSIGDCPAGEYAEGALCKQCADGKYNALPQQKNESACIQCTCADVVNAGPDCKQEEITTGGAGQGTSVNSCKNVCDGRCTGSKETCKPNPDKKDGFECICQDNYVLIPSGGACKHRCEADWCFDRGTQFCIRDSEDDSLAICRCEANYEGLQCDVRKDPQGDTQFIIGGAIGAAVLVLLMLLLALWICWCFKKDRKRIKKEPTVAPTIYQPYPVAVYDSMPFASQPPKAGTVVGSYGRNMYYPSPSGFHDTQSMTGYNMQTPDNNIYSTERVYGEHGATQQFYEDPPDDGPVSYNDYSSSLPNGNPYQGATAFSEGGLYAEVNKMM